MGEPTIVIHPVADETTGRLLDRSLTANAVGVQASGTRICIAMVGLPARGKSYTAQKLTRWLHWLSVPAQTFNVGMYRRKESPSPSAEFFDNTNPEGERLRRAAAEHAVNDMVEWFNTTNGVVAILDATNSTKIRRQWIRERCSSENIDTMFVESICNDTGLIMSNIRDVKASSPDYVGMNPDKAVSDFLQRIENYQSQYETIDEDENSLTYVKMIDVGAHIIINAIKDMLQTRVVYYLMNLHIRPRTIWLSRVRTSTDLIHTG
jgi:6-phosphofructo-2-kinase/fructose-2,6-biphosphatase 2